MEAKVDAAISAVQEKIEVIVNSIQSHKKSGGGRPGVCRLADPGPSQGTHRKIEETQRRRSIRGRRASSKAAQGPSWWARPRTPIRDTRTAKTLAETTRSRVETKAEEVSGRLCPRREFKIQPVEVEARADSDPRTNNHILLPQIWDSPNLEGQVPIFISPSNKVAQLYPQALG
jgi:hypothetical protein